MEKRNTIRRCGLATLFFFTWFCLVPGFSRGSEEDPLIKARKLIKAGSYEEAARVLGGYIEKIRDIAKQKNKVAEAHYLLARMYYEVGEDQKCDDSLREAFRYNPELGKDEVIFDFRERMNRIRAEVAPQAAEKLKKEEERQALKRAKPKKKFPWLLAAGVVAATILIVLLLTKKNNHLTIAEDPDYDTNVLGIQWLLVPAGEFKMGDNFGEGAGASLPVHFVYLDTYSISKNEVTFDQYDRFCDETGQSKPSDEGWGRGSRPVINVNRSDAKSFCDWLSAKTGKKVHLPTEAQWEKAARGTDQRKYPWGNTYPTCSLCNYDNCVGRTQPVGSCPAGASPYGALDMAGNVYELCQDWYGETYYQECFNQGTVRNPQGPGSGSGWAVRGGSWNEDDRSMPSFIRAYVTSSKWLHTMGFRLAQD